MNERIKQSILRYRKHVKAMLDFKIRESPYWSELGIDHHLCNLDANIIAVFFMKQIRRGVVSPTGDNRG